ncbi:hypothetical protein GUITHDRAFT_107260 [Guillardia theta CCMP2712]|uniref:Nucleosome assembly protein n=1 Tax=Guillardia theta (strain CCMP2712) TaxID=905079 RepID=L1JF34_GUITC|nr:hypothetical protein GUITHDRAFT_107260 [Guillardia theta CCMP2712]EKX46907.1 hypothetical protein GUITHDRAFT_107260 [Guillardia theta CCMP2712]|eukprot:XP_005833887.1 hypothetical protein GUITHDRAFT_107260 [Guillardia theta CCMP2712]
MGNKKGHKDAKHAKKKEEQDSEEDEEVSGAMSNMDLKNQSPAAPFTFAPAPKGQSPFSSSEGKSVFTFPTQPAEGGQGNFTFNFAPGKKGKGGDDDDEDDDEDEEDDDEEEEDDDRGVEEFIASLPEPVQECVAALNKLDEEVCSLQSEFRKELRELERKYEQKEKPLFAKRADIITGRAKPENAEKADGTGIPDFWLGAMKNCGIIGSNITEKDEVILKFLSDITAETLPEEVGIGFCLKFYFHKNEFFTNEVLTKTYFLADSSDDSILEKVEGTEIAWESGKNVTVKIKKKKQRSKNGKGTRTVTKTEPCESFFNFFSPPHIPDPEDDPLDDDELESRRMELESDYEMGIAFQERVIPHAIKWFTGEAEDDDDDDDDYDDEEEYFDEEEEEDEEDEDEAPHRGHGGHRGGGRGGGRGKGKNGEECKQQ